MLELGPLAFGAPWMLAALVALPVLWWLLRITPPAPRLQEFPPLRMLLGLRKQEETPAHTPLWLILLRMLIAALVIIALAHPLYNPGARLFGSGPLVLVIDDGWAAAPRWRARTTMLDVLIDRAERDDRAVIVLTTAPMPGGEALRASSLMRSAEAKRLVRAIRPKPWPADRKAALAAAAEISVSGSAHVAWLSDGLDDSYAAALAEELQTLGALQIYAEPTASLAHLVRPPAADAGGLTVPVLRAASAGEGTLQLRASAEDGRLLDRQEVVFADGKSAATARFNLPGEMRNAVARIQIEEEASAGAIFLVDERWRRRPVGIASGETTETAQPLLSDQHYLARALRPFSEVRRGTVGQLLARELAVLVLADIGKLSGDESRNLGGWIERGGVVVRFAGPRMAKNADELIPVRLRGGGRALGGAMSWTKPARLLPFTENSPFAGIKVPRDVLIRRQVLAEPTVDLGTKTWARLADGTPLVTAEKRGKGWLILVHTTANTEWSSLPISGLFLQMLQRIVGLSQGVVGDDSKAVFPPLEILDGFGVLGSPPSGTTAISGNDFAAARPGPATPPGYYGRGGARRALNLSSGITKIQLLQGLPAGVVRADYALAQGIDFKPLLLLAALILIIADLIISYVLRGLMPFAGTGRQGLAVGLLLMLLPVALMAGATPLVAQTSPPSRDSNPVADSFALEATRKTRLAYVRTGDRQIDTISRAGLAGLSQMLRQRTAVEPGKPMEVNIERDELAFFPVLYWPISPRQPALSERATEKLNQYLRGGGTILFDTRDRGSVSFDLFGRGGAAASRLRFLLGRLDIPPLIPVPTDHVLNKAFYLLNSLPGRWSGGAVWVERRGGRHNDGVSPVVIGGHDWAGAWAADFAGAPMLPTVPGGARQREMAYRFGINWVMYALTGNYKADQVHAPAILERLGQ